MLVLENTAVVSPMCIPGIVVYSVPDVSTGIQYTEMLTRPAPGPLVVNHILVCPFRFYPEYVTGVDMMNEVVADLGKTVYVSSPSATLCVPFIRMSEAAMFAPSC